MDFCNWLKNNTNLKETSIKQYEIALKHLEKEFSVDIEPIKDYSDFIDILNFLENDSNFKQRNAKCNNVYSAALHQYGKYIKNKENEKQYFWLKAKPQIWSFSKLRIGEIIEYTSESEDGKKRRIYNNFKNARKGDLVIAYESTPTKKVMALCEVYDELKNGVLKVKKKEDIENKVTYKEVMNLQEMRNSEVSKNNYGTLFKLTKTEYDSIINLIKGNTSKEIEQQEEKENKKEEYEKREFLDEVYISENKYNKMVQLLKRKKNIILQGAPGVGKTFMAKRLAYSIMGEKDDERIKFIQFHQSYCYEDFIEGWKPNEKTYTIEEGIFKSFCKMAQKDKRDCFLLIDEINRGNLSKIFGELLMLIENDKRDTEVNLVYSKKTFTVPSNVYIIGMMNTADRSLAMIDYALRRRFAFCQINPAFDSEQFKQYQNKLNNSKMNQLINLIKQLNMEIEQDSTLGAGFKIGHSYFCNFKEVTKEDIESIIEYEILPLLEEYWFDDIDRYEVWFDKLNGVIND